MSNKIETAGENMAPDDALDSEPFSQSDIEFQLDTLSDRSRESLEKLVGTADPINDIETTEFLRGYLMDMPSFVVHKLTD